MELVALRCARLLAVSVLGLLTVGYVSAQSRSLPTDRGPVVVRQVPDPLGGPALRVLRTDADTPIRAGTAWLWSQQWLEEPPEYYGQIRGKGLNAVRIILFDTWIREGGYGGGDWNDESYRNTMLARLERAVDACSRHGLYAIINSHNKIPEYDEAYNEALWRHVAARFRNRSHVIFEASNEALAGTGIGEGGVFTGDDSRLAVLRRHADLIRSLAPDRHLMVLTPAGISGWGYVDGMVRLVQRFESRPGAPIDWTKTSVAYHLYHADENLFPQAQNLRNLHSMYPGWPSENNFPRSFTSEQLGIPAGDDWRSPSFGDDLFLNQTCERLGLGWSHWHINRSVQLERNWPYIWNDAVSKGYAWTPDPALNRATRIDAGGNGTHGVEADVNFIGGTPAANGVGQTIDRSRTRNAAPAEVYQTERWGRFSYTLAGLDPGRRFGVRLHFAETWSGITGAGQRVFGVKANGSSVLSDFDIFAAAGNRGNRAVVRDVAAVADARGRIVLEFIPKVQEAKVDGIELLGRSETSRTPAGR